MEYKLVYTRMSCARPPVADGLYKVANVTMVVVTNRGS
jgi:hypothetical protein